MLTVRVVGLAVEKMDGVMWSSTAVRIRVVDGWIDTNSKISVTRSVRALFW